ncbi:MAG TPA: DegV family protein [Candidatus Limnocylindrales bacterium]
MGRVAIVTDSASDLPLGLAEQHGIRVVPLAVTFGQETFKAGVELSTEAFWARMTAPDAPFPTTAASSPGDFRAVYESCFADGAEAVVSVQVAGTLSAAIKSAEIARSMLADREIHVVDSGSASMGQGLLALLGSELAAAGTAAAEIARVLTDRAADLDLYVALDTLEYLRKGGRISGAQAAVGTILSVKPIITIRDGAVETADRVRTAGKARARVLELMSQRPVERLAILYSPPADPESFRDELLPRLPDGVDSSRVSVQPIGPSVGPHLGPGCIGGVLLYRR